MTPHRRIKFDDAEFARAALDLLVERIPAAAAAFVWDPTNRCVWQVAEELTRPEMLMSGDCPDFPGSAASALQEMTRLFRVIKACARDGHEGFGPTSAAGALFPIRFAPWIEPRLCVPSDRPVPGDDVAADIGGIFHKVSTEGAYYFRNGMGDDARVWFALRRLAHRLAPWALLSVCYVVKAASQCKGTLTLHLDAKLLETWFAYLEPEEATQLMRDFHQTAETVWGEIDCAGTVFYEVPWSSRVYEELRRAGARDITIGELVLDNRPEKF